MEIPKKSPTRIVDLLAKVKHDLEYFKILMLKNVLDSTFKKYFFLKDYVSSIFFNFT
jgi:hypothetical protein